MKRGMDVCRSMNERKEFTDSVGYGRRTLAWHTESTTHLQLITEKKNTLQHGNTVDNEYYMDQSTKKNTESVMDDPKKGACSFGENLLYHDSNIPFQIQACKGTVDDEHNE